MRKNNNSAVKGSEQLLGLLISELQDMYDGENQIIEALPDMIEAADSPKLKDAFTNHLEETEGQVARLEKVFRILDVNPGDDTCEAMEGLIKECSQAIDERPKSPLRDAALIAKAQRIEHYEMSVYGTMKTFAKELGLNDIAKLLQENQDEEINADKKLTKLAEGGFILSGINQKANKFEG